MSTFLSMSFNGKPTQDMGKEIKAWASKFHSAWLSEKCTGIIFDTSFISIGKLVGDINSRLKMIAILFQRLCARTPLDEPYVREVTVTKKDGTKKTKIKFHKPDFFYIRYEWYVVINGNNVLTARDAIDNGCTFDNINDEKEIDIIYQLLLNRFKSMSLKDANKELCSFDFKNTQENTDKFFVLEYGRTKWNEVGIAMGERYPHGVEKKHSVQAPYGMLRITMLEFQQVALDLMRTNKGLKKTFADMLAQQNIDKTPTQEKIVTMLNNVIDSSNAINGTKVEHFTEESAVKLFTELEGGLRLSNFL